MRPGRVPSIPRGRWCSRRLAQNPQPPPAASQRPPPSGPSVTRHHRGFTVFTRPAFPLPVTPGWDGSPWASPPSFTPRRCQRRMSRWGQALEHWPGSTSPTSVDPPICASTRYVHLRVALPSRLPDPGRLAVPTRPVVVGAASRPHLRPQARTAPSFGGLLRQAEGGALSSPPGHVAPRGARRRLRSGRGCDPGRENSRLPPIPLPRRT